MNIFGPDSSLELAEVIDSLEQDTHVKVVVFDSAVEGFFLARLSRLLVVSIAVIGGRATGVGSELALASDIRFASREKHCCHSGRSASGC